MCLCVYVSLSISLMSVCLRVSAIILSHQAYYHLCRCVSMSRIHTSTPSSFHIPVMLCLCVCVSVRLCVYVSVCVCVCVYVLLCLCVYASVSGVLCVCACMCLCVYVSVFLSHDISERGCKIMSMCLCVCVCMCLCFCVAVCLPCMSVQHHTLQYTATALQPHRNTMHSATHCSILQHTTLVYV